MGSSCSKNQQPGTGASTAAAASQQQHPIVVDAYARPYHLDKIAPKRRETKHNGSSNDIVVGLSATTSSSNNTIEDIVTTGPTTSQAQQHDNDHHHSLPSLSPIYDTLPPKAKKVKCIRVYDGDTITLANQKRVRLLGIDTPELSNPKQAYSEEAKQYTLSRCLNQTIWISFENTGNNNNPQEDRYGRLLAWIWIPIKSSSKEAGTQVIQQYECVNEGLISAGLATYYIPSKQTKLFNSTKLIDMQEEARLAKRGLWKLFHNKIVLKTNHGIAFHHLNGNCIHLSNTQKQNRIKIRISLALDEGLHACRTCLAEEDDENSFTSNNNNTFQLPPPPPSTALQPPGGRPPSSTLILAT